MPARNRPAPGLPTRKQILEFIQNSPVPAGKREISREFGLKGNEKIQLKALLTNPVAIAEVPLFLVALLIVRGLPALLYRRSTGTRHAVAAGLLQATTLTFVIVATQIGLATGKITPTAAASLLAAGLLSAALFPAAAQRLLPRAGPVARHNARVPDG